MMIARSTGLTNVDVSGMRPDHIKNIGKAFENAVRIALAEE